MMPSTAASKTPNPLLKVSRMLRRWAAEATNDRA